MYTGTVVYAKQSIAYRSGKYRVFNHEGGARSSKTTSIIQFLIEWAHFQSERKRIIICRKKNTWTRATVLYDFINIMEKSGVYNFSDYNKSTGIITYKNVEFWFGGLDDPQRLHGFTSDGVWINEANEATKDDFDQLEMRCSGFMILDYNPNMDDDHWIVKSVISRPDCKYIHSTVLHNPFAPENVRKKIMSYEPTEENYAKGTADKRKWDIYGLGKRAKIEGLIFDKYELVKEIPFYVKKRFGGIDFGYTNDVTAIVEVGLHNNEIYIDEKYYRTHMLTSDIIKALKASLPDLKIWSESADPRLVDEIYNSGINIHPVVKGAGSIIAGIDIMKSKLIRITERSTNVIHEFCNYTYAQDKNGKWLNEPIDDLNHTIDAIRYVCLMELLGRNQKQNDLTGVFF